MIRAISVRRISAALALVALLLCWSKGQAAANGDRDTATAAATAVAVAANAAGAPSDGRVDARLKHLAEELRCLVCQNQTLADSTAPLAGDLREQIKNQIGQGRSDDQIREFMVERYGDFILYKPPVKPTTWLLWGIPFVLLIGGAIALFRMVRRADRKDADGDASGKERPQSSSPSTERFAKAREWLDGQAD